MDLGLECQYKNQYPQDLGLKFEETNIEIRINIFEVLCVHVRVCQFSGKTNSFDFFSPNLPKNGFRIDNSENYCRNKNPRYTMRANFQSKWTTLNFSAQICPKKDLGFETEKNNVGIIINIVETLCVPIFNQTGQLSLFWPKFAQKWILGLEFQKSKCGLDICTSMCTNFQLKWITLTFLAQIFPKRKSG